MWLGMSGLGENLMVGLLDSCPPFIQDGPPPPCSPSPPPCLSLFCLIAHLPSMSCYHVSDRFWQVSCSLDVSHLLLMFCCVGTMSLPRTNCDPAAGSLAAGLVDLHLMTWHTCHFAAGFTWEVPRASEDLACTALDPRAKVSEIRLGDMQLFLSVWVVICEGTEATEISVWNNASIKTSCGFSVHWI